MEIPLASLGTITDRCSICGYLLTGLPAEGRCPECGHIYGPSILILWGRGGAEISGRHTPPVAEHISTGVTILAFLLMAIKMPAFLWQFLVFSAPLLAYLLYRQWSLFRGRHGWQARLSPEGYGSRAGLGRIRLHPWSTDDEINIIPATHPGYYVLSIRHIVFNHLQLEFPCTPAEAQALRDRIQQLSNHRVWLEQ